MSENVLKPGDLARHVQFDFTELLVVRILDNGSIGCRYRSIHQNEKGSSDYVLHYAEFEPFELYLSKNQSKVTFMTF